MMKTYSIDTDRYSFYRTYHHFDAVVDIKKSEDFYEAMQLARQHGLEAIPLGNGSNVFFKNRRVRTLLLRNCLPAEIKYLGGDIFQISSSTKVMPLLRRLYSEGRDGPYYLASVPATIGGAIAMNAGSGRRDQEYISDFLIDVTYLHNGEVHCENKEQLDFDYRSTIFSESTERFILSARFRFASKNFDASPIKNRLNWAKKHQDLAIPNCGSVWCVSDKRILKVIRLLWRGKNAWISGKSPIWISNRSGNPRYILRILRLVSFLHRVTKKSLKHEIRIIK